MRRLVLEHRLRIAERQNSIWPRVWSRCRARHIVREQNIITKRRQPVVSLPACVFQHGVRIADPSQLIGPAHQGKRASRRRWSSAISAVASVDASSTISTRRYGQVQAVVGRCQGEHAGLAGQAERLNERWITAGQNIARSEPSSESPWWFGLPVEKFRYALFVGNPPDRFAQQR